jgi:hypothetical protein
MQRAYYELPRNLKGSAMIPPITKFQLLYAEEQRCEAAWIAARDNPNCNRETALAAARAYEEAYRATMDEVHETVQPYSDFDRAA